MGLYDLAELRRGDLGRIVCWEPHGLGAAGSHGEVRAAPPVAPEVQPGTPARVAEKRAEPPVRSVGRRSLSSAELLLLDWHLTPQAAVTGLGATIVPKLLEGLRALVRLGLPNQRLRACEVRALFATRAGIEVQACSKTFGRALAAVAAHTRIVRRDGRRWLIYLGDLLLADSELMRWIAEVTPAALTSVEGSSSSEVGGEQAEPAVVATDPEDLRGVKAGADECVGHPRASPEGDSEEEGRPRSNDREEPADEGADPVGQSLSAYQQYRLRLRRDGPLRVTRASVPIEESASRGEWKKARDPP